MKHVAQVCTALTAYVFGLPLVERLPDARPECASLMGAVSDKSIRTTATYGHYRLVVAPEKVPGLPGLKPMSADDPKRTYLTHSVLQTCVVRRRGELLLFSDVIDARDP